MFYVDLYQITMAYGYWKNNKKDDIAVFDLFFRKNPFRGEFTIFAGVEECIKFLDNFKFSEEGKLTVHAFVHAVSYLLWLINFSPWDDFGSLDSLVALDYFNAVYTYDMKLEEDYEIDHWTFGHLAIIIISWLLLVKDFQLLSSNFHNNVQSISLFFPFCF